MHKQHRLWISVKTEHFGIIKLKYFLIWIFSKIFCLGQFFTKKSKIFNVMIWYQNVEFLKLNQNLCHLGILAVTCSFTSTSCWKFGGLGLVVVEVVVGFCEWRFWVRQSQSYPVSQKCCISATKFLWIRSSRTLIS